MTSSPKHTGTIDAGAGAQYARIVGVGGYRPDRVITNAEVCTWIESSDEWIRERSGIISRRWAAPEQSVVDMAEHASRDAIARSGIPAGKISAVIMATVTHPYQTPAAAPLLATRLGADGVPAFDISAACAGYCHGISLANDMVRGGSAEYVLVVGVEKLSDFTDKHDRGTAFIFGDGAGAAIVGPSDHPGIGPTVWGSKGDAWDTITQREPWTRLMGEWEQEEATGQAPEDGKEPHDRAAFGFGIGNAATLTMKGQSVFRWAVWSMAPIAQQALDKAGVKAGDLDAFIPHQANMRIIDQMIKQLQLPSDIPVARDIAETGNTSAASIPLATERMLREGEVPSGGIALQIGFGAGLVYAAQVIELP